MPIAGLRGVLWRLGVVRVGGWVKGGKAMGDSIKLGSDGVVDPPVAPSHKALSSLLDFSLDVRGNGRS